MRENAFALLLASILFLSVAAAPTSGQVSGKSSTVYGLSVSTYNQSWNDSRWISELKLSGCTWIKMNVYSDKREVFIDSVHCFQLLRNESVKCLGVFGKDSNFRSGGTPDPIDNLTEWQTLVHDALQNYGEYLDAVECWNEPDLPANQNGYMNGPQHYIDMLQILHNETETYRKIHGKTIAVVAGSVIDIYSVETTPEHDKPGNGTLFIRDLRDLNSDDFCDAYSMHIYKADASKGANPEQFLRGHTAREAYDYIKNIVDANSADPRPLWVSEMGTHNNTAEGQANQMQTWFEELTSASCPMMFWYNYIDSNPDESVPGLHGILETGTFKERPAFYVFQSYARPVDPIFLIITVLIALVIGATIVAIEFSRRRARKKDSLNRPDHLLRTRVEEGEKGLAADPKLTLEKERISEMLQDSKEKYERGEMTSAAYERLKSKYEGKQKEIENRIKASLDKEYLATARSAAKLEELRALGSIDEETYQKLKQEYERKLNERDRE